MMRNAFRPLALAVLTVVCGLLILSAAGCKTNQGSREFIPGHGWVPTR